MSETIYVALLPRDGMFFKDGRGWFTSSSGRGRALKWPYPSTLLGVLRTAWGHHLEAHEKGSALTEQEWNDKTKEVHLTGILPLRRAAGGVERVDRLERELPAKFAASHRMWPVPADAWYEKPKPPMDRPRIVALPPEPTDIVCVGRASGPPSESLWWPRPDPRAKPYRWIPDYWNDELFVRWLCGWTKAGMHSLLGETVEEVLKQDMMTRVQSHVGIDPETYAHVDGILFASEVVETLTRGRWEWGIGLRGLLPAKAPKLCDTLWTLGGDRRAARPEAFESDLFAIPEALAAAFDEGVPGLRLVVVSPMEVQGGWLPGDFKLEGGAWIGTLPGVTGPVRLRAAYVNRPVHVSGWDVVGGRAKKTRRLVPPGSVYFFTRGPGDTRPFTAEEARALWWANLGAGLEEDDPKLGWVVPGVWWPPGSSHETP